MGGSSMRRKGEMGMRGQVVLADGPTGTKDGTVQNWVG